MKKLILILIAFFLLGCVPLYAFPPTPRPSIGSLGGAPANAHYLVDLADGTLTAEVVVTANGKSLVIAANYAAMKALTGWYTATGDLDAELQDIAGLTFADDKIILGTGAGTIAMADCTVFAQSILDDADEATFKATVNLEAGTDFYSVAAANAAFEIQLNNAAGLYAVLSDVTAFIEADTKYIGGVTIQEFTGSDATPDVSNAALGTNNVYRVNGNGTITDFDDADDHSEFADGDWFGLIVDDATSVIDFSANANIEGNAGVDYTGSATQITFLLFVYYDARWNCTNLQAGFSDPITFAPSSIDMGSGTIKITTSTSGDQTRTIGQIGLKADEDMLVTHGGAAGECQDEVGISLLQHRMWSFDPDAICDLTTDRLFLMTVGDDAPHGIRIVEWKLSFDVDPTTEFGAGETLFKRATAFIGVGSTATIDDLATTNGVSSEDTAANINSNAAVANGQVLYLDFPTAYTEALHQVIFEVWYYLEED